MPQRDWMNLDVLDMIIPQLDVSSMVLISIILQVKRSDNNPTNIITGTKPIDSYILHPRDWGSLPKQQFTHYH